jgi:hypothetical protein
VKSAKDYLRQSQIAGNRPLIISTLTFRNSFALSRSPKKMEELYVVALVNSNRMKCIVPLEMLLAAIPIRARRSGLCPN